MVDEIFSPNTFDEYLNNTTGASSSRSYGAKLAPVKQWERDCFGSYCSCCGFYAYRDRFGQPIESKFCPNCGEELRREEEVNKPSVDIVTCRECEFYHREGCVYNKGLFGNVTMDDYCSHGVRREEKIR